MVALAWIVGVNPLHAGTVLILSQTAAKLTALDSDARQLGATIDLAPGPANLTMSPDGRLAYVAHSDSGKISVVDLAAWRVASTFAVPGSPFGLAVSAADKLYVGDWNGSEVHELDAATGQRLRSITIGKAPAHLALTADGRQLLAVAREANTVSVIDSESFTVAATLAVERAPFALAIAPDGSHAVVANAQAGSLSTIDLVKKAVTATTRVGAMPYGVAFSEETAATLVTNQQSGTVSLLPRGNAAPSTIKVGSYPEGVAVAADGRSAFVANWFSDDLSVIAIDAQKEVARIKVPTGPRAIAIVEGSFGR